MVPSRPFPPASTPVSVVRRGVRLISDDLQKSASTPAVNAPTWTFSNDSSRSVGTEAQCQIDFQVPYDLGKSSIRSKLIVGPHVFLYYKLTN